MSQQNDRKLLELAATAAGWMPNNSWTWCDNAGGTGTFCYRVSVELVECPVKMRCKAWLVSDPRQSGQSLCRIFRRCFL